LSAGLLDLVGHSNTNQSIVGFELLQCLWGIVNESETSCLSTTKLSLKTENVDLVLVGLVQLCKLASELILGDVGTVWVEYITIEAIRFPSCKIFPITKLSIFPSSEVLADSIGKLTRPFACGRGEGCE